MNPYSVCVSFNDKFIIFNNLEINGSYIQNKWSGTVYQDWHRNIIPEEEINWKTKEEMTRTNFGARTCLDIIHDYDDDTCARIFKV